MSSARNGPGPLFIDLESGSLAPVERERLAHPLTGGVILFTRNYEAPDQLSALTASIRAAAPDVLIAVDHEGGRVQRFREGFSTIEPMRALGEQWQRDAATAVTQARTVGALIARELGRHDVDFSFTPVLDLDYGSSSVIGDRAFHRNPSVVTALARALVEGLHEGGMAAVGKHFPGHGYVAADSHAELPIDARLYSQMEVDDLAPFAELARDGVLDAVMPAHVVYSAIDERPAGFSPIWLCEILRMQLRFGGLVISDDLCMAGAEIAGGIVERAQAAVAAGCDMVLACNDAAATDALLDAWRPVEAAELKQRAERMRRGRAT